MLAAIFTLYGRNIGPALLVVVYKCITGMCVSMCVLVHVYSAAAAGSVWFYGI